MDAGKRRDGDITNRDEKDITSPSTQPWNLFVHCTKEALATRTGEGNSPYPAAADVPGPPSRAYLRGLSGRHPISIGSLGTETTLRLCTCVYPASLPRISHTHLTHAKTNHLTPQHSLQRAPSSRPLLLPPTAPPALAQSQKDAETRRHQRPRQTKTNQRHQRHQRWSSLRSRRKIALPRRRTQRARAGAGAGAGFPEPPALPAP